MTLPIILTLHGFQVTVAATVPEALKEIAENQFDLLLSDLNIGEPGDGFTVVSAMRRTQPSAATVIITGYPAFETALRAIQSQVDDYVLKPAEVGGLVKTIREKLSNRRLHQQSPLKKLTVMLQENKDKILENWLWETKSITDAKADKLSDEKQLESMSQIFDSLVAELERCEHSVDPAALRPAWNHGTDRRTQGYDTATLVDEIRVLEKIILTTVEENLITIDLSTLFSDLRNMNEIFRLQVKEAVRAFSA